MTPTRQTFPATNLTDKGTHEIVFYDWGNPDAVNTTVCVHGLTRNARDFDVLAEALVATGRRVISINMAGRGESAWLADPMQYNYATYVADCMALLDNFHLRKVEWIGTSMGGIIGMMIAAQPGGRIRKLVMNDIGDFLSREALTRIYDYARALPTSFENRAAAEAYLAENFKSFGITDPAQWARFVDASLVTRDGALAYACDPAIAEPLRVATKDFTDVQDVVLTSVWEEVDIPTLLIRGSESDVLSADTVRLMRRANTRADTVTINGVGHAPALMSEDQIRTVLNWLNGAGSGLMAAGF